MKRHMALAVALLAAVWYNTSLASLCGKQQKLGSILLPSFRHAWLLLGPSAGPHFVAF
jgi:hypothetical protein